MKTLIQRLASVKITCVCLFLLFVLTFWGTVAQVDHGLYAAQERYFFSFFFKIWGWLPFPGAQLVLWVLFVNLIASVIVHFSKLKSIQFIGLKLSHFGVLFYFIAAFVIFHATTESYVHLSEGQGTNISSSYSQWEMAYWPQSSVKTIRQADVVETITQVTAYDLNGIKSGERILFKELPVSITVEQFYPNVAAYRTSDKKKLLNASGISILEPKELIKEREKNIAGGIFNLTYADGAKAKMLLYGAESVPTPVKINGETYLFLLRHKAYKLPFTIRLKEFKAEFHPGTKLAKSFESLVEVIKPGATRDVRIVMNNPLRDKDFTFYQASYDIDQMGRKYSTLAVVKNAGQILPYIACFLVFIGLSIHFIWAALRRKRV